MASEIDKIADKKANFLKQVADLRPDLYFPESWSDDQRSQAVEMVRPNKIRNNLFSAIPMRCRAEACHPAGTLILTNTRGYIPIEELAPGDKLVAYDTQQGTIRGHKPSNNRKAFGFDFSLHTRNYSDTLYNLSADGYNYECTYDHICITKWNRASLEGTWTLYLQRKGNWWRIGIAKSLFGTKLEAGILGASHRAKSSGADSFWILDIFKSREEALLAEAYYSTEYGIPQTCFTVEGLMKIDQDTLNEYFERYDSLIQLERATKLLKKFSRSIEYPFWNRTDVENYRFTRTAYYLELRACNVVANYMDLPIADDGVEKIRRPDSKSKYYYKPRWSKVSISVQEAKDIIVYSLDVEKYHTYVANRIITHNCPYAEICPLMQKNIAPKNLPCPLEMAMVQQFVKEYIEELGVDPDNLIEVSMVRDLIDQEIQQQRTSWTLSLEHFIQENVVGISPNGEVIQQKQLHLAVELQDKLQRRKRDIRNQLLATREAQAKAGQGQLDSAQMMSSLMDSLRKMEVEKKRTLAELTGQISKDDYIDAEEVSDEEGK